MDEVSVIVTRPYDPVNDAALVYSTWRNSAYYGSVEAKADGNAAHWFKKMSVHIKGVLDYATVRIACLSDDPTVIIGYSIWTGSHLHWIYVKVDYRCKGVGKLLFPKGIDTVTDQQTKIGQVIAKKHDLKTKENE